MSKIKCPKTCVVHNLITHNVCFKCENYKDSPYYKATLRPKYRKETFTNFEGKEITCNYTAKGRYDGYLNYFDCPNCENQVVGEDKPFMCNREKFDFDITDTKRYCLNYEKRGENK